MKKRMKNGLAGILSSALIMGSALTAGAADVEVYAEGAYTDTDLVVYIYADINTADPLVSAGVSLNYNTGVLTFTGATKNETVWYFGEPGSTHPYVNPDDSGATGKISYLLGKIKESAPTEGVVPADRVLLGTASFSHSGITDFSSVTLSYGNDAATFANFVTNGDSTPEPVVVENSGTVDMSSVVIRERGDANRDGAITNLDIFAVKDAKSAPYCVIADCNEDGAITNLDIFCVKDKK